MNDELQAAIDAYIDANWENVIADIRTLVQVPSVEDLDAAAPNAPYGPGPRKALDGALSIAERMGLDAHDCDGYVGYADLHGERATQIGIIGHVDVVPAGPGWSFEPYDVTKKDGFLLGRGVADDKGPLATALHAVNFWHDRGVRLPYTIRVLFGANEETNMKDIAFYRAHYADPAFLFTPDAEFPVCYGEAGICSGVLASAPLGGRGACGEVALSSGTGSFEVCGAIEAIEGGVAVNAVPGTAWARVRGDALMDSAQDLAISSTGISLSVEGESVIVNAQGKSAHASTPELGRNAIDLLCAYLLRSVRLADDERAFLQLVRTVTSSYDGSGLGVQAHDEHFGDLTCVGGTIRLEEGRMLLTIDFRYPTTTAAKQIEQRVQACAASCGATFEMQHDKEPFLMDPDSPAVQALLLAYNQATGEDAKPFTMKGGTYARVFSTGVSFGPEKPWETKPDWVGSMHGPDEGIREDLLKQAFAIYVRTIARLMELNLE